MIQPEADLSMIALLEAERITREEQQRTQAASLASVQHDLDNVQSAYVTEKRSWSDRVSRETDRASLGLLSVVTSLLTTRATRTSTGPG
jgi:hypothetical protein